MKTKVKKIEKLDEGWLVYTNRPVLNAERQSIIAELKQISANALGLVFFRAEEV